MAIITQSLLNFPVPVIRKELTGKDLAFYALSVGAGQDVMDPNELMLVDANKGPVPLPSAVVVLCRPGFWLADPATGVDVLKVVYGEQGFVIHKPLPLEGAIIGRTRVTGIVDKGAGKGALIYTEKTLSHAVTGDVFATTTATIFARGDGGFGGPEGPIRTIHTMPETEPDDVLDLPTRPEQALYYRLNGDMNPLHADPATALRAGFPRPILHGLCTVGVVCRALVRVLCSADPSRLQGLDLRFSAPVFPGETVRTEMWRDGSFRARVVERDVLVINNGHATIG